MRWPWESRVIEAEQLAQKSTDDLEDVKRNWHTARKLAFESREQRELNGWTAKVLMIFSGEG